MNDSDWNKHYTRCLGMRLEGQMDDEIDDKGRHIVGDTLLILFNSHNGLIPFLMPPHAESEFWQPVLDTATDRPLKRLLAQQPYPLQAHSLAVLRLNRPKPKLLARARSAIHNVLKKSQRSK